MPATGFVKRLWALEGGTLRDDRGALVVGESGPVTLPCPSFLIEHERGLVLMDTGLVPAAADDPVAVYGEMGRTLSVSLTHAQRIDKQIEALGFALTDVRHVIMSHLHWDHTGGMFLFPHAEFHVMSGELQYARSPLPDGPPYRIEDITRTSGFRWNEIDGPEFDFFEDGSLVILHMPGHSPGNASLLVRLESRTILLAADTAHLRSGYLSGRPMPSDWNTLQSVQSLRRLRQIARNHDAMVWILHDPEDWAEYRHAPDFYA